MRLAVICVVALLLNVTFAGNRKSLQDLTKGDRVTVDFQMSAGQYQALRIASQ